MSAIGLRPITAADESILFAVYAGSRAAELAAVPWDETQKSDFLRSQFDAQQKHYLTSFSEADYSVVEADGDPVGRFYIDRRSDEIRILDIALLPDKRGRGIGTCLIRSLFSDARVANMPIRIYVESNQRSKSFFERLGFEVAEDEGISVLMEWNPESSANRISLRDACGTDDTFLFDLFQQLRATEFAHLGWDQRQVAAFVEMQFEAQVAGYRAQFPDASHEIVLLGDRPIGRIIVERSAALATLVDITLMSELRGQGIGTGLIEDLLHEAAAGDAQVRLKVSVGNPARRLYERLGFQCLGGDDVYEQMEWKETT